MRMTSADAHRGRHFMSNALRWLLIFAVCLIVPSTHAQTGQARSPAPTAARKWKLIWQDEFNGQRAEAPDKTKWSYQIGGHGWGNQELQYYTDAPETVYLDGEGHLVIQASKATAPSRLECWYGPCQYISGRITTRGKFSFQYGRAEARIKLPRGQGIWPAFWMVGDRVNCDGWPACGEIDIMENIGREPFTVHGTIHGPGYSGAKGIGAPYRLTGGKLFADDFHLFAIEWEPNVIRWYVDEDLYETRTPADLPPGTRWVFDRPFHIILNVAVGGKWPGAPDGTTQFPQRMLVDYVRVYQRETK